ncbi:protein of unknown function [Parapedobacter composti]|uniref:DUF748 domain-containing protein n=1 Tax=Parapedobacter composti TaxID=623281 RepID=A0A1I1IIH1_9SPHI|nr:DUF748 domain-containing protein [Parapedobacter composti]SFC36047.1 protein of unknown function [Parapedobacter composti]
MNRDNQRSTKNFKWKRAYSIVAGIALLLIVFRLLLPTMVLRYANNTLANLDGYYGQVADIDIALYRGAYQLNQFYLNKVDSASGDQAQFFRVNRADLSIEWRSLFRGALVGELVFESPELIFTKDKAELDAVARDTNDFRQLLRDFMPLRVNRFEVRNGSIRYIDSNTSPIVDIALEKAHIVAENLKNTARKGEKLPSNLQAEAQAYGGTLTLYMELDALARRPTFDLTAEIEGANLPELNDFFIAYGKFDVSQGTFGLYSEFAADGGRYKGYVKPIIKGLEVMGTEDRKDGFFQRAKEAVVEAVTQLLENPKAEQVATRVPIEGSFGETNVLVWEAVWQLIKNAFIEALMPSVDHQINIDSPKEVTGRQGIFKPD